VCLCVISYGGWFLAGGDRVTVMLMGHTDLVWVLANVSVSS
jgi:hypothetical protein